VLESQSAAGSRRKDSARREAPWLRHSNSK
jgi:hypothetical protein